MGCTVDRLKLSINLSIKMLSVVRAAAFIEKLCWKRRGSKVILYQAENLGVLAPGFPPLKAISCQGDSLVAHPEPPGERTTLL